jgi:hypothetical protein
LFDPALQNLTKPVEKCLICSVVGLGVLGSMNVDWSVRPADVEEVLILPNSPLTAEKIHACKHLREGVT